MSDELPSWKFCMVFCNLGWSDLSKLSITDEMIDRFYEAGCSDALLGLAHKDKGIIFFDFTRQARTREEAIESAQADIFKVTNGFFAQVSYFDGEDERDEYGFSDLD